MKATTSPPGWLKLVVQMIDPVSDSLLLLYDDAQSIYRKSGGLKFSLSSVGIKAPGRTTILRLNYRNSREILQFAYEFARTFIAPAAADDDHIPLIEPQSAAPPARDPLSDGRKTSTPRSITPCAASGSGKQPAIS